MSEWGRWGNALAAFSVVSMERVLGAFLRVAAAPIRPPPEGQAAPQIGSVEAWVSESQGSPGGVTNEERGELMTEYYCNDGEFAGDDLKLVEVNIVSDKFGDEAWLYQNRVLINYSTTREAVASQKLSDFLTSVVVEDRSGNVTEVHSDMILDSNWKKKSPNELNELFSRDNRKYIYARPPRIVDRWPRRDRDYDKEQVHVLRNLVDVMKNKP